MILVNCVAIFGYMREIKTKSKTINEDFTMRPQNNGVSSGSLIL